MRKGCRDRCSNLSSVQVSIGELYAAGLTCDAGVGRCGRIVWVVREHCNRCSGLACPADGIVVDDEDRLPCDRRCVRRAKQMLAEQTTRSADHDRSEEGAEHATVAMVR